MPRHPEEHRWLVRLANVGRSEVPRLPDRDGRPTRPRRLEIFAVGTDWLQVTWSALGPGTVSFRVGDHRSEVVADGGPGAHLVEGLPAGTTHEIEISGAGVDGATRRRASTLELPGEELLRVATVSDVHVGSHSTGYLHTIVERPEPVIPHTLRCLDSALHELKAWDVDRLVVKGDLVDRSTRVNWSAVEARFAGVHIPIDVLPGNHERSKIGDIDPDEALRAIGLHLVEGVETVDHGGVRIVLADTVRRGTDHGTVDAIADDLIEAVSVDAPTLVALHHQPTRFRVPLYLPPGIPGPQVRPLLRSLGDANQRVLVTSGHTHRHRRHDIDGVTATEVGSTKDFPGTWAGYQIHEGGIVQTVRRISEPTCIRWTDHTRRAAAGLWPKWSPGRIQDRCFTLEW